MTKSGKGRSGRLPAHAMTPRLGVSSRAPGVDDLLPSAKAAPKLEAVLAQGSVGNPKAHATGAATSPLAPQPRSISSGQAREAHRLAVEGVRLIHQGRFAQASPLLERSVKLNPRVAGSHHDLGVAMLYAGRMEQAIGPFTAALDLDPNLPSGHLHLGHIFDSLGQEEKAMAGYQAAVALKPDLFPAQTRLGGLYETRRMRSEAAAAFRAAAAAAGGTVDARVAELRALDVLGLFDEALAAARAVVEAYPEHAEARVMLGKLLGQAGHTAEAAAHHILATELAPGLLNVWSGVASLKKFAAADGPLIARMNAALALPHLTPPHRQAVHFALGKAHDDMGNYEAAMRNFEAGNRFRALGGRLRREALVWRIDRLIEATAPGYRDGQPDRGVEDATPVLIVGLPRCGSTLTEQILSSHPDVAAGGEMEFWKVRDTPRVDEWSIAATPEATQRLAEDYLATLRAFGPVAKRVTDKTLSNFMLLGIIHRVFPNATFIHCRRHPIDNALSIFTTNFEMYIDFVADRSDIVFFTRQYQRLMAHWREVLPSDRLIEVDCEALVADPEPHTRRLIAACGLDWNDACLAPHRNTRRIQTASVWQARQPIYRTSVERWRRYEPWLGELRELAPEG
jgi:tetratricopeptide (TPR) repeat protein